MKTSNKLLLLVLVVAVIVMVGSIVGVRVYVDSLISNTERSYDVRDFDSVRIAGEAEERRIFACLDFYL